MPLAMSSTLPMSLMSMHVCVCVCALVVIYVVNGLYMCRKQYAAYIYVLHKYNNGMVNPDPELCHCLFIANITLYRCTSPAHSPSLLSLLPGLSILFTQLIAYGRSSTFKSMFNIKVALIPATNPSTQQYGNR